jgi:hypothetical protein
MSSQLFCHVRDQQPCIPAQGNLWQMTQNCFSIAGDQPSPAPTLTVAVLTGADGESEQEEHLWQRQM